MGNLCELATQTLDSHITSGYELYTLRDLLRIELEGMKCALYTNLSRIVTAAVEHVRSCETCRIMGHYCPICASHEAIFAFEIDKYEACSECGAVYHRLCFLRADAECPKCLRLRARTNQSTLSELR